MRFKFLSRRATCAADGDIGLSTLHLRVRQGLLPPPIKRGRSSLWFEHEIEAIHEAIARGASDAELKELVKQLVNARNCPVNGTGNEAVARGASDAELRGA